MIKIGEGETSEVFKIDSDRVVKLFKHDFYNDHDFNIEYDTAKYIGDNSNLAPKIYEKIQIDGRSGFVMEEIKGSIFQKEIDNNPQKIKHYAKLLGDAHRTLHNKKINHDLQYLCNFKNQFNNYFASNESLPKEVNIWLKSILSSLPDETVLLHGDFMPYNIIISDGILHVVDWAEPTLGPAMVEIARTINFILDPTDYPDSEYTKNSQLFIDIYLNAYFKGKKWDSKLLHDCLILNSVFEYSWAVKSNQIDSFSTRTKEFIINNFNEYGSDKLIDI